MNTFVRKQQKHKIFGGWGKVGERGWIERNRERAREMFMRVHILNEDATLIQIISL